MPGCTWLLLCVNALAACTVVAHTSTAAAAPAAAALAGAGPLAFVKALDLSYLPVLDCGGACPPFSASAGGPKEDALAMAAARGINTVRVRLWVAPSADTPSPWPAGNADYTYANLSSVAAFARRIAAAKLSLWLDLHFSSVWADPGHQAKPAGWASSTRALADNVSAFTAHALGVLAAQGTPPSIVQVGNEITAGMLWAAGGAPCADGGALFAAGCNATAQWPRLAALVAAGVAAVRAAAPSAYVLIHTDLGNRLAKDGAAYIVTWYSLLAAAGAADFDGIGLSFYPNWGSGPPANVQLLAAVADAFPGKGIILAETAFNWQGSGTGPFPFTPAGQHDYLVALLAAVRALNGGAGLAYWGGEYFRFQAGSGWAALWDTTGVALPALSAWAE